MPLSFPLNPTIGQQYTAGGTTWQWDGSAWNILPNNSPEFDTVTANVFYGSASGLTDIPMPDLTGYATETYVADAIAAIPPTDLTGYATETYVGTAISNLVDTAPATLDTLNELAAALGDDANFATTVTTALSEKAPINNPTFTGTVTLPGTISQSVQRVAIGNGAGSNQNLYSVAIGNSAGSNQAIEAVAIGSLAAGSSQGRGGIAIGASAGTDQAAGAVAIGEQAGRFSQGASAVAIGKYAGNSGQVANSIVIDATESLLSPGNAGFYVAPIRSTSATNNLLFYNTTSKEITLAGLSQVQSVEVTVPLTSATGSVIHDFNSGAVFVHSSISSNFTANFTNVSTTNDRTTSAALILVQGATAYMPTAVQIDNVSQTLLWQGGAAPTGTANGIDIVRFTLIRKNDAWTAISSATSYS